MFKVKTYLRYYKVASREAFPLKHLRRRRSPILSLRRVVYVLNQWHPQPDLSVARFSRRKTTIDTESEDFLVVLDKGHT